MLAIQGCNWELGLLMSEQANSNLQLAYNFISEVILNRFSYCITG